MSSNLYVLPFLVSISPPNLLSEIVILQKMHVSVPILIGCGSVLQEPKNISSNTAVMANPFLFVLKVFYFFLESLI
jgi:ABC-type amino acid transport system permease subunit